jgi:hypothetical protein
LAGGQAARGAGVDELARHILGSEFGL